MTNRNFGQFSARRLMGNALSDNLADLRDDVQSLRVRRRFDETVTLMPDLLTNRLKAVDDDGLLRMVISSTSLEDEIGVVAYLAALNTSGEVTFYVDADTGKLMAARGEYVVDEDGTHSNGLTFLHAFDATFGGIRRQGYFGMFVPDGGDRPSLRIYYNEPASSNLILNGSFESGDETSWTDTNTSWSVAADATYGYAAQHDNTDTGCPPTLPQTVAVSASTLYLFTFASKMASGDFPPNVSLIWKDAGSVVLRTDTAIGSDASAWVEKSGAYTSPSTAATVTISVHPGEIFTDCYVSGFELFELTAFSAMDFHDGKIIVDAVPGKPVNLFGLPQSAMNFAQEFVYSATATTTQNSYQRFAFFRGPTAANAANADTIDLSFVVAAGTYTLTIIGVKDDDCGITDGYIDGSGSTEWTGDDWYNALAISYNATFNHTVTFTTGGRHTLQLKVNGKNAASSDYAVRLSAVYLTPVSHSVEA